MTLWLHGRAAVYVLFYFFVNRTLTPLMWEPSAQGQSFFFKDIVIGFGSLFIKSKKDRHCRAELPYSLSFICVAIL